MLTLQTSWKQTSLSLRPILYGDGELPDEMMDFYEDLADLNLMVKSTEWSAQEIPSTMNSVRLLMTLTAFFVATGAEKGSECVKVDLSAEEEDIERLEQFAEELAAKVG